MELKVSKAGLTEVQALPDLFLTQNTFQFVYNKCHGAGWADIYLFTIEGIKALL